ncbi:MAG: hypothetical protein RJQ09_03850 [Cyclobacteriaceae bacterium]
MKLSYRILASIYFVSMLIVSACSTQPDKPSPIPEKQISEFKNEARQVLPDGEAKELVINNCVHCHSHLLITQNQATGEGWQSMIVWMQETQGLWPLGQNEEAIVAYLAKNFAPQSTGRRIPLVVEEWYELK